MATENAGSLEATSLFIGLESYTEAQSDVFYGRDGEIERLTSLIKSNTLTIVFGKSGTGKTSLLNAGVFPRLRKEYCLPFRIRLQFSEQSPDLVTQIKAVLRSEIDKYGFSVESYPSSETSLWEYFHSEPLWKSVTPILVFDQFEEIFTLARKSDRFGSGQLEDFWQELGDLIENSIPEKLKPVFLDNKDQVHYGYKMQKAKIVFAFREEFLPEFEGKTGQIPSLKSSRFRLLPMNGYQAYEVITRTWKNAINETEARRIVGYFVSDEEENKNYELIDIEPSLLSQVCTYIDRERMAEKRTQITADFLEKYPKEKILHSIYNEVLAEGNEAVFKADPELQPGTRPLNVFLEDNLITDEGFRTKYADNEIAGFLLPGIEILKRKYFLRDDGKAIEITHDVLAPIVLEDREARRKAVASALAKRRANKRALLVVVFALLAAVAIWYWIAGKAVSDKDKAVAQRAAIQKEIARDSASLAGIRDSIQTARTGARLHGAGIAPVNFNNNDSAYLNMLQLSSQDSIRLWALQNRFNGLSLERSRLQEELAAETAANGQLREDRRTDALYRETAGRQMMLLQRKVTFDSTKLADLQEAYRKLSLDFEQYRLKHPETYVPGGGEETDAADTNSLKLRLRFEMSSGVPDNLLIYAIPVNSANAKTIRKARVYEIGCDPQLDRAKGSKTARYRGGLYVFYNIAPGNYFIKVCSYYGGFRYYTKTKDGNVTIDLDASPPIR